jgi:hypothetical protein
MTYPLKASSGIKLAIADETEGNSQISGFQPNNTASYINCGVVMSHHSKDPSDKTHINVTSLNNAYDPTVSLRHDHQCGCHACARSSAPPLASNSAGHANQETMLDRAIENAVIRGIFQQNDFSRRSGRVAWIYKMSFVSSGVQHRNRFWHYTLNKTTRSTFFFN